VRDVNGDGSLAIGYDDGGRDYHVLSRLVRRPSATAPSASTPLADAGTPAGLPPPPPLEQRALDEREHERWCYSAEEARPRRECERRQLEQMRCDEAERAEQARRKRADVDITAEAARLNAEAIAKVIGACCSKTSAQEPRAARIEAGSVSHVRNPVSSETSPNTDDGSNESNPPTRLISDGNPTDCVRESVEESGGFANRERQNINYEL